MPQGSLGRRTRAQLGQFDTIPLARYRTIDVDCQQPVAKRELRRCSATRWKYGREPPTHTRPEDTCIVYEYRRVNQCALRGSGNICGHTVQVHRGSASHRHCRWTVPTPRHLNKQHNYANLGRLSGSIPPPSPKPGTPSTWRSRVTEPRSMSPPSARARLASSIRACEEMTFDTTVSSDNYMRQRRGREESCWMSRASVWMP